MNAFITYIIGWVLGCITGCFLTLFVVCCFVVAGRCDK